MILTIAGIIITVVWILDAVIVGRKLFRTTTALTRLSELVGNDFTQAALELEAVKLRLSYLEGTIQQNPELFQLYAKICNPTRFEKGQ